MRKSRERSVGPEWSREAGLRLQQLRLRRYPDTSDAGAYRLLHEDIAAATKDWPDGPVDLSPATLRAMELGRYDEEGEITTRRMEVGELRALAVTFGVSTDFLLGLTENERERNETSKTDRRGRHRLDCLGDCCEGHGT